MRSDLSLINAARYGDGEAFGKLVDRYASVLFRFGLSLTRDPHEAEELAQETLVDFYRHLERYEPRAALATYLCMILKRKMISAARKRRRRAAARGRQRNDTPSPLADVLADERLTRLKGAVDGLDDGLRIIIELRYMQGLKLRQIADALSLPLGTVKSRVSRALIALRTALKEEGDQ